MEKRIVLSLVVVLSALVGQAWAQALSMPGPQTSFLPPKKVTRVSPTPRPSKPQFVHVLRPMHATPTPYKARFYSLQVTPHPTPNRYQKPRPKSPNGTAALPGPRKLQYHTLYENPTPTGSRAAQ